MSRTNRVAWGLSLVALSVLMVLSSARAGQGTAPPVTGRVLHGQKGAIWSVSWSPHGQQLASVDGTGRTIGIWAPGTGQPLKQIAPPEGEVVSVRWTSRGLLAVLDRHRDAALWNATTGKVVVRLPGFVGSWVTWDRRGRRLAAWGNGGGGLWDLMTGKFFNLPGETAAGIALSPDGSRLALVSLEGNVRVTDAITGRGVRVLQSFLGWDFGHSPRPAAWSPDGRRVAAATFRTPEPDDVVRVWDTNTGKVLFTYPDKAEAKEGGVVAIAWSPDGKRLAYSRELHSDVWLWKPSTEAVRVLSAGALPLSLAFSPDGSRLAAGCSNGSVVVWEVRP